MKKLTVIALIAVTLTGCATRGANYTPVVDMKGRDWAVFSQDTGECQAYAKQRMDAASGAVAGAVAIALLGAMLAPRGYRGNVAAHGAILGGAAGAGAANESQETSSGAAWPVAATTCWGDLSLQSALTIEFSQQGESP